MTMRSIKFSTDKTILSKLLGLKNLETFLKR
jgi:hypothetical protein